MNILGIHLTMLIGQNVPRKAPLRLNEALQSVEVTHNDSERSGFQLTFQIGRSVLELMDYKLVKDPLLKPFNRVMLAVYFNVTPHPLMDGIITNQQLAPGDDPGAATLTVTGEDVSLLMDLEDKVQPHPAQDDDVIVRLRVLDYAIVPQVLPPPEVDPPIPTERTPVQHSTDLAYIRGLAERHGYVFYIIPGLTPLDTRAYWGPPDRQGRPQRALSVNMGPHTNVASISFRYDGLKPNKITYMEDENSRTIERTRRVPVVQNPASLERIRFLSNTGQLSGQRLRAYAQAEVDKSLDQVVTASGELDALRYGGLLQPRKLVDLRGAGKSYDGTYYVKSVTHKIDIRKGEYRQSFTLNREGLGTLSPFVSV